MVGDELATAFELLFEGLVLKDVGGGDKIDVEGGSEIDVENGALWRELGADSGEERCS